jgi:hypothetical protein
MVFGFIGFAEVILPSPEGKLLKSERLRISVLWLRAFSRFLDSHFYL